MRGLPREAIPVVAALVKRLGGQVDLTSQELLAIGPRITLHTMTELGRDGIRVWVTEEPATVPGEVVVERKALGGG